MKPELLALKNFGPFRGEHAVDFTGLGDIFLVYGKTGAGKTTIFDAISYALYGEAPGDRKGMARSMRSQFADDGDESAVAFTFAIAGKRWRVTRTLPFDKIGVRSGKLKTVAEEVTLDEFSEGAWKGASSTNKSETDGRIVDLIGLSCEEFSRIILLPQGEFARFLKLNSNERKAVLSKLFPVGRYAQVTALARDRAKALKDRLQATYDALAALEAEFDHASYDATRATVSSAIETLKARRDSLRNDLGSRSAEMERFRAFTEKKKRSDEISARLTELEGEQETIAGLREKLNAASRAAPIAVRLDSLDEIRRKLSADSSEIIAVEKEKRGERDALSDLESRAAVITGIAEEKNRLFVRKDQLRVAVGIATTLENELEEYKATKKRLEAAAKRKGELDAESASLTKRRKELDTDRAAFEKRAEEGVLHREALEKAKQLKTLADEYAIEKKSIAAHEGALANAVADLDINRKDEAIARAELEAIEAESKKAHIAETARALAETLEDGSPCPVCGSLSHPSPACIRSVESFDYDDRIKAGKRRIEQLATQAITLEKNMSSREADLRNAKSRLDVIIKKYCESDTACITPDSIPSPEDAAISVREAAKRMQEASDAINQSRIAARECDAIDKRAIEIAAEVDGISRTLIDLERIAAGQKAETAQKTARYREAFPDGDAPADPSDALERCEARILAIEAEINAHEEKLSASRARLSGFSARLEAIDRAVVESKKALALAEGALEAELAAAGFANPSEVRTAALADEKRSAIDTRVRDFDRMLAETKGLLANLTAEIAQWDGPTTGYGEDEIEDIRQRIAKTDGELEKENATIATLDSMKARHDALELERTKRSAEAGTMAALANDLTGANTIKTSFDAWILGMYLEEITAYANERLERMSEGRYRIQLNDSYRKGNAFAGLELEILDAYTGKARPSATLSGGETFMTSISLALGLADSIQSRSGGIQLDAVFIDEGFGSLDESSLERAITILDEIRDSRMVGLISHVGELRTRIPNRIEVIKTVAGSSIRREMNTQGEI